MKKHFSLILLLCATLGASAQTYNDGTWYSLYSTQERKTSDNGVGNGENFSYTVATPTSGSLSFEWKKSGTFFGKCIFNLKVTDNAGTEVANVSSGTTSSEGHDTYVKVTKSVGKDITSLTFNQKSTLQGYHKNVFITLAKHILLANGGNGTTTQSKIFTDTKLGASSEAQKVEFRSFLTGGNLSVTLTSGDPEVFRLGSEGNITGSLATSDAGNTYAVGSNAMACASGEVDACTTGKKGKVANYGFSIYFCPKAATDYNGVVTVTDGTNTATINLSGKGLQKTQYLTWLEGFEDEMPLFRRDQEEAVAKSSQDFAVVYTITDQNPLDEDKSLPVFELTNEGTTLHALRPGSATITVTQEGDETYAPAEPISKTFKVSDKRTVQIKWDQNLMRLKTGFDPMELTASAYIQNEETAEWEYSEEKTVAIVYSSENADVVSVEGNMLSVVGIGTTTMRARFEGDVTFEEARASLPVKVRDGAVAGCDDPIILNRAAEMEFFQMNTNEIQGEEIAIDRSNHRHPDKLSFQHKGAKWASVFFTGAIKAQQKVNGSWQDVPGSSVEPTVGEYKAMENLQLDANATAIRFVRPQGGQGYHYIKNVEVTLRQTIEAAATVVDFASVQKGANEYRDITIYYANIKSDHLNVVSSNEDVVAPDATKDAECGDVDNDVIRLTLNTETSGVKNATVTISDEFTGVSLVLTVKGIVRMDQTIEWEPNMEVLSTDNIALDAVSSSHLDVTYSIAAGSDVATIEEGVVKIHKAGQVTITASQEGNDEYNKALPVSRTFTISKATPVVTEVPTASAIAYLEALENSQLAGGEASVEGSFAWEDATLVPESVGTASFTAVFTPDNTDMYTTTTCEVEVMVTKTTHCVLDLHATSIQFGEPISASVLSNGEGTPGVVTWEEEDTSVELAVGEHNLKVLFTPDDTDLYEPVHSTVTLMVTRKKSYITWKQLTDIVVGQEYTLDATSTSGEEVTFVSSDPEVASVFGNVLVAHREGVFTLTAKAGENSDYEAAEDVVRELEVVEVAYQHIYVSIRPGDSYIWYDEEYTEEGDYYNYETNEILHLSFKSVVTADEVVEISTVEVQKVLYRGQIYILRDGHKYDLSGRLVK